MAGLLGGLALLTRMGKISGASVVGLASGIACICGIRGLGKQASARLGNTYSLAGVTCGLAATGYAEARDHPAVRAMDHPSAHAPYAAYYDAEASAAVAEYMAADIARFGYRPPSIGIR